MATVQPTDGGARDSSVEATEGAPMMGGAEPEALAAAAAKTCLPQRTLCPLPNRFGGWKEGFETYHIALFLVGLIFGNIALLAAGAVDRPTAGCAAVNATAGCAAAALPVEELLQPSNPTMKLFLLTTVALIAKCHLMTWLEVWMGCKNNSFSKNVWVSAAAPCASSSEASKQRLHTWLHRTRTPATRRCRPGRRSRTCSSRPATTSTRACRRSPSGFCIRVASEAAAQ